MLLLLLLLLLPGELAPSTMGNSPPNPLLLPPGNEMLFMRGKVLMLNGLGVLGNASWLPPVVELLDNEKKLANLWLG